MRTLLLHVEDDDAMAIVFRAAVEEADIEASIFHVSDGEQALDYLRRGTIRPDLVFLDLNMPRVDGWQVLTAMRADGNLRAIPVVVLSTSFREMDKDRAYRLGAMHYITKPFSFEALVIAVKSVYRNLLATGPRVSALRCNSGGSCGQTDGPGFSLTLIQSPSLFWWLCRF